MALNAPGAIWGHSRGRARAIAYRPAPAGRSLPASAPVGSVFKGVTAVYARHDYALEKRAALQLWADHVELVLKGRASTVVALRR